MKNLLRVIVSVLDEDYKTKQLIDYIDMKTLEHLADQDRGFLRLIQNEEHEPEKIRKILSVEYKLVQHI